MAAAFLPSNLVTSDPNLAKNPNWAPFEPSVPQANVLVEPASARLMIVCGKHPKTIVNDSPVFSQAYLTSFGEGAFTEESAIFAMKNVSLQQCTAVQLEKLVIYAPGSGVQETTSRNLNESLCGDLADDNWVAPRRFVVGNFDLNIPFYINGTAHRFNIVNHLPKGQAIAYYTLADVLQYLCNAWIDYMQNRMGDSSFTAYLYTDTIGPRLFWYSSNFDRTTIRLNISEMENMQPNFLNLVLNHIYFTDINTYDTTQSSFGYASGESMGLQARSQTGFQNNAAVMTVHSSELTQFRKSDSIAPTDGSSLIGVCYPTAHSEKYDFYQCSIQTGDLVAPKIAFDRTQTLTELSIFLRVLQGVGHSVVSFKGTEMQNAYCIATFRCW